MLGSIDVYFVLCMMRDVLLVVRKMEQLVHKEAAASAVIIAEIIAVAVRVTILTAANV